MKKIFMIALFMLATMLNVSAENNNIIEKAIVNVPSYVSVYEGDSFDIKIRTINKELYNLIKYEIKDNKLYIDLEGDTYLINDQILNPEDIRINIQVPHDIEIKTNNYMLVAESHKNNKATNDENN